MDTGLKAFVIPVTPFQQNCSVHWCTKTNKGAVVDPGGDLDQIDDAIAKHGIELEKVLVTHGHIDHAGGVAEFAERHNLPIEGPHKDEIFWISQLAEQGERFGLAAGRPFEPDRWLDDGDTVTVGDLVYDVVHCPGHTPGHVVFIHRPGVDRPHRLSQGQSRGPDRLDPGQAVSPGRRHHLHPRPRRPVDLRPGTPVQPLRRGQPVRVSGDACFLVLATIRNIS